MGDAYNAEYRKGEAPASYEVYDDYGTPWPVSVEKKTAGRTDMMYNNGEVSSNDVRMLWEAWSKNKLQLFPTE